MDRAELSADPDVARGNQRLLGLQRESAVAVGALAALGGATAISMLYSANRGSEYL